MADKSTRRLGDLLLEFNYIDETQLDDAINKQKNSDKRLGELLVDLGYIKEKDLIQVLEFQLGIPHVNISNFDIQPDLAQYIPENIALRYDAVPLEVSNNVIKVAMVDPANLVAIDDMERVSDLKIEPYISTQEEIKQAQGVVYSASGEETAEVFASLSDFKGQEEPEIDDLKEMVDDAPIVKLTNIIINQAIQMRASDIHIEPETSRVRIRYRIDGVLREHMTAPKYSQAALTSRLKIMADLDITKRRIPQDGRVRMNVKGLKVDMRVSTLPTIQGEKVVIRLLNRDESLLNIDNLGFTEDNLEKFKGLINKPYGILLVTGPTGSGKSTTLFAALNRLNTVEKNIVTIEDPVEYQIEGINQVHANRKTGLTFARTLRSILRQDPDIIMVGEIRDEETAQIAVRAALTGHLVLSTLHTNDATSSITRLVDMGIPPYLVASTVLGVVAQRLVRRLCEDCKVSYQPGPEEKELLGIEEDYTLYKAGSCDKCSETGFRGRLAVQEVLTMDEELEEMIVANKDEQKIKNKAREKGMKVLNEDGMLKVLKGLTSYQELGRVII